MSAYPSSHHLWEAKPPVEYLAAWKMDRLHQENQFTDENCGSSHEIEKNKTQRPLSEHYVPLLQSTIQVHPELRAWEVHTMRSENILGEATFSVLMMKGRIAQERTGFIAEVHHDVSTWTLGFSQGVSVLPPSLLFNNEHFQSLSILSIFGSH